MNSPRLMPHLRRAAAAALSAGSLLSLPALAVAARGSSNAAPTAELSAITPAEIPSALVALFDARRGSAEARRGRRLIALWTASSARERNAARPGLEASLSRLAPEAAVRLASLLPIFDGEEALLVESVQSWARADAGACVAWVQSRRPGAAREASVRAIAALGDAMPAPDAAAWAAGELPPGAIQDAALAAALVRWSAESPADAASWAHARLEGAARETAVSRALETWGARDLQGARRWMQESSDEQSVHDAASAGLAQALATTRPGEALALTSGVSSPEQRQQLLQGRLKHWHAPVGPRGGEAAAPDTGTAPGRSARGDPGTGQ